MKKIFIFILTFILLISLNSVIIAEGTRKKPYQMGEKFNVQGEGLMTGKMKI